MMLALLVIATSGCGASSQNTTQYKAQSRSDVSKIPLVDRVKAAKNGTLYCPFKDECQPAVALISVVTNEGIERCTGFLISDNQVLTNDHCVSKSVAIEGTPNQPSNISCKQLIYVHFAKSGKNDEALTVDCQSIQMRSFENGVVSKDYAILKLASSVTDRKAVRLSDRGFDANEPATIYRVQMDQNATTRTYDGVQTRLDCQSSYATLLYPALVSPRSPLMSFGDCAIQAGNSGSPVFNRDGKVGAIIQGFMNLKESEALHTELNERLLDGSFGQVAIGTQMSCIPELNDPVKAGCGPILNAVGQNPAEFVDSFVGAFKTETLPKTLSNEIWSRIPSPAKDEQVYLKVPRCIDEKAEPNASYSTMMMSYRRGINRFLQAEWRSRFVEGEQVAEFKLVNAAAQNKMVDLNNPDLGTISLPVCRDLANRLVNN
jgi:V8-like Glu-specific endopeptidase